MNRRALISLLGGAAAGLPLAARAQQVERLLWRIVSTSSMPRSGFELCEGHHGMDNLRKKKPS